MPTPGDPFLAAQQDIISLLSSSRPLLTSYLRIRSTAPNADSPELIEARRDLEAALSDLSTDLADLVDSVAAAEQDPYRFGLSVDEVARRRGLVRDVGEEVEGMRREVAGVIENADYKKGLPDPRAFAVDDEDGSGEGDAYEEFEQERQQELLHEQDEALDGVFRTVGNLRLQADEMGRELEEQGELLDSVDVLADRMGGKLQQGLKRMAWVIKENEDTASSCCIGVLILVLIILLILVLVL